MRNAATIAALLLTTWVSACSGPKQQEFTREDGEAIRANARNFTAAFNQKEIDKLVDMYADNSVFMPPNAPMLRGREPLKSFYGDLTGRGAELQMEADTVAGHGPLAYEAGTYTLSYSGGGRDRGKYLRVLRKTADTWRTGSTIWSSDLPPSPRPADGR